MRAWAFIAIGLVVALVAVIGPPLIQLQNDSRAARARNAELESVVENFKKELDAANQARTELQGTIKEAKKEANFEIEKRQSEITRLSGEVERLNAELERAIDLAKDADALNQQEDAAPQPSNGWQPR
jgi:hypothetical protein